MLCLYLCWRTLIYLDMKLIKKAIKLAASKIKAKQYEDIELICEQVLKIDSKNLDALYLLSVAKYKLSKKEEFKQCFDKIFELTPNDFNANNSLGLSYLHLGNLDKAIFYFKKAVKLDPKNSTGWSNLGCQFRTKKIHHEAIRCLSKAHNLNKKDAQTLANLAGAYGENLQIDKSISCLKKALEINPNLHSAHVDLACAYYLKGNYDKAWTHYQHRFEHYDYLKSKINQFEKSKKWNGKKIKDGKKILFFCEQGIGDSINFIRFINDFKKAYPNVIAKTIVPNSLYDILSKNFTDIIKNVEDHDYWCSVMDLPHFLKMNKTDIKNSYAPYIKPSKTCDYSSFSNLYKIGICWAGNPQHPKDEDRSCYLSYFKEIYKIPKVKLFSLQKDLRPRVWPFSEKPIDLSYCQDIKMINMANYMESWDDTASIISGLDLVISVDTSVLHLSGALGKKTFAVIPYFPDWRWGLDSMETFWYPNMTIFRQKTQNDWCSVFDQVKNEININI